jgi:methyl-accepting chemotaxis protein
MFRNLKISTRLTVLSLRMFALVIAVVILGRMSSATATTRLGAVYQQHAVPMAELGQGLDNLHRARMQIVLGLEAYNQRNAEDNFKKMGGYERTALAHLKIAFDLTQDDAGKKLIKQFETSWKQAGDVRDQILKFYGEGDRAQALTKFRTEHSTMPPTR